MALDMLTAHADLQRLELTFQAAESLREVGELGIEAYSL
jgi:hypothetical protein